MFGEMSFLSGAVACASVVAEVETEVWQIKKSTIDAVVSASGFGQRASFHKHLATYLSARVRQLTSMVADNVAARSGELTLQEVLSNAVFFSLFQRFVTERKLVDPQLLFFLQDLNEFLQLPANDDMLPAARKLHARYLHGDAPTVRLERSVAADVAELLASDTMPPRDLFAPALTAVLGQLQQSTYKLFQQSPTFQPLLDLKAKEKKVPEVCDFKLLQILGEGYEGKVLHTRKKDTGCMYALKVLDKPVLASRSRRWQLHASRELECLIACDHPYIVRIAYAFQTPQYLYMVQEHVPNHTMSSYLDAHEGRGVREVEIRFMVSQLVLALAHMHAKQMLYRDLKPANVLIDADGHMRMVDMGMATRLDPATGRRKSVCGTQRYMAPEMKAKQPYHHSVDWYSLGKLILDFQSRGAHATLGHADEAKAWDACGLVELVDGLLVKDPERRLGCGRDGVRSIERLRFFADVDWAALDAKKVPSPLRPEWYVRQPDVARQFRNGEDIGKVVEKLQHLALDGAQNAPNETGPGDIPNWDYVHPRAVYAEYLASPYHNAKLCT